MTDENEIPNATPEENEKVDSKIGANKKKSQNQRLGDGGDPPKLESNGDGGDGGDVSGKSLSSDTDVSIDPLVVIGCKYPNGLRIQLHNHTDIILHGCNAPKQGHRGGIGYTQLNRSVWEKIATDERYQGFVRNGLIFLSDNGG